MTWFLSEMARLPQDRLGPPPRSSDEMRAAFGRLAGLGEGERALFALISALGLTTASQELGIEAFEVAVWISETAVPPDRIELVCSKAADKTHTRRGPLPGRRLDPRREQFRALCHEGHSTRRLASILGVSRDTVMRWRKEEEQIG